MCCVRRLFINVRLSPSFRICDKNENKIYDLGRVLIILPTSWFEGRDASVYALLMIGKVTLRLAFSLTKAVHLNIEAFLEAASLTLIPSLFIDDTVTVAFAGIYHVSSHASHEKTTATIARIYSIMATRRNIPAHFTKNFGLSFNCFKFLWRWGFSIHFTVFWRI